MALVACWKFDEAEGEGDLRICDNRARAREREREEGEREREKEKKRKGVN